MVSVPSFILKRLYVKGSLHNTEAGIEFEVLNKLGSGYARQMLPVTLNGQPQPMDKTYFCREGGERIAFADVSEEQPFTLEMGRGLAISVDGLELVPGQYKVGMGFIVQGIGELKFEVADVVS